MLRIALGLGLGLALAFATLFACETATYALWPPPAGLGADDPGAVAAAVRDIPAIALAAVLTGWTLATLLGAAAAAFIARRAWAAQTIAVVLLARAVLNMSFVPHPWWMWLGALIFLPLAGWTAGRAARAS